jgi:hypothetical protein
MADLQKEHRIRHPWRIPKKDAFPLRSASFCIVFFVFPANVIRHPASTIYGRLKTPSIDHTWAIKKSDDHRRYFHFLLFPGIRLPQ